MDRERAAHSVGNNRMRDIAQGADTRSRGGIVHGGEQHGAGCGSNACEEGSSNHPGAAAAQDSQDAGGVLEGERHSHLWTQDSLAGLYHRPRGHQELRRRRRLRRLPLHAATVHLRGHHRCREHPSVLRHRRWHNAWRSHGDPRARRGMPGCHGRGSQLAHLQRQPPCRVSRN